MCYAAPAGFVASLVPILLFTASCASSGDDKADTGTQKRYPSPTAVFDAYREARSKRDWRKCFSCLTPEEQNNAVFESFFECAESNSKESRAICKKYGLDEAALNDALEKTYKAKHGVDVAKSGARTQSGAKSGPPPRAGSRLAARRCVRAHQE